MSWTPLSTGSDAGISKMLTNSRRSRLKITCTYAASLRSTFEPRVSNFEAVGNPCGRQDLEVRGGGEVAGPAQRRPRHERFGAGWDGRERVRHQRVELE